MPNGQGLRVLRWKRLPPHWAGHCIAPQQLHDLRLMKMLMQAILVLSAQVILVLSALVVFILSAQVILDPECASEQVL